MTLKTALHLAWSEHGTWAMLFISFGMGLLAAWPPGLTTLSIFVGLSALATAKVLYVPARQGRISGWLAAIPAVLGIAGFVPLICAALIPLSAMGLAAVPFAALFALKADDPKWGRAIAVETTGVVLLSASAGLAVLASRPLCLNAAALATAAAAALFLPGVVRARLLKKTTWPLRFAVFALALAGAAFILALALWKIMAPFGALAALAFAGDIRAVILKPKTTVHHLGLLLTARGALAALILALAWRQLA